MPGSPCPQAPETGSRSMSSPEHLGDSSAGQAHKRSVFLPYQRAHYVEHFRLPFLNPKGYE
jgi:hypothetical protein